MVNVKLIAEKLNIAAVYRCIENEMATFVEAKTGAVAMIFALAILPLMLVLGVGIDYQRATRARWLLQAAVDAAAITVAKQPSLTQTARNTLAQNIAEANLGELANHLTGLMITETEPTTNSFKVTATGSLSTAFMQLALISQMTISATAGAQMASVSSSTTSSGPGQGCVLSLDHSEVDSLDDMGNSTVTLTNCDIYDNSNNSDALNVGGNAALTARFVSVTGGVSGASKITTTNGIAPNTGTRIADVGSHLGLRISDSESKKP